jgi:hypothetical protein
VLCLARWGDARSSRWKKKGRQIGLREGGRKDLEDARSGHAGGGWWAGGDRWGRGMDEVNERRIGCSAGRRTCGMLRWSRAVRVNWLLHYFLGAISFQRLPTKRV